MLCIVVAVQEDHAFFPPPRLRIIHVLPLEVSQPRREASITDLTKSNQVYTHGETCALDQHGHKEHTVVIRVELRQNAYNVVVIRSNHFYY